MWGKSSRLLEMYGDWLVYTSPLKISPYPKRASELGLNVCLAPGLIKVICAPSCTIYFHKVFCLGAGVSEPKNRMILKRCPSVNGNILRVANFFTSLRLPGTPQLVTVLNYIICARS